MIVRSDKLRTADQNLKPHAFLDERQITELDRRPGSSLSDVHGLGRPDVAHRQSSNAIKDVRRSSRHRGTLDGRVVLTLPLA
jgi:hypothetical protein